MRPWSEVSKRFSVNNWWIQKMKHKSLGRCGVKLLASAGSLKDCIKLIERFWYSKPDSIVLLKTGKTTWGIWQNDVEMNEFRVRQQGLRFRFEYKGDKS